MTVCSYRAITEGYHQVALCLYIAEIFPFRYTSVTVWS